MKLAAVGGRDQIDDPEDDWQVFNILAEIHAWKANSLSAIYQQPSNVRSYLGSLSTWKIFELYSEEYFSDNLLKG